MVRCVTPHPDFGAKLVPIQRYCNPPSDKKIQAEVREWYIFPSSNPIFNHELSAALPSRAAQKPNPVVFHSEAMPI